MQRAPPRIAFVHVPRTGGTSLGFMLRSSFEWREVLWFTQPTTAERFFANPHAASMIGSAQLISGHVGRMFKEFPKDSVVATVLREPVKRLVSLWNYSHEHHFESIRPHVERGMTLVDLTADDDEALWAFRANSFTRAFAGLSGKEELRAEHLETAKRRLEHSMVFGFTDRLSELMADLGRATGRPFPTDEPPRINASVAPSRRFDVSPEACRMIEDINAYDMELYDFAETLWAARRREGLPDAPVWTDPARGRLNVDDLEAFSRERFEREEEVVSAMASLDEQIDEARSSTEYLLLLEKKRDRIRDSMAARRSILEGLQERIRSVGGQIPYLEADQRALEESILALKRVEAGLSSRGASFVAADGSAEAVEVTEQVATTEEKGRSGLSRLFASISRLRS